MPQIYGDKHLLGDHKATAAATGGQFWRPTFALATHEAVRGDRVRFKAATSSDGDTDYAATTD